MINNNNKTCLLPLLLQNLNLWAVPADSVKVSRPGSRFVWGLQPSKESTLMIP